MVYCQILLPLCTLFIRLFVHDPPNDRVRVVHSVQTTFPTVCVTINQASISVSSVQTEH